MALGLGNILTKGGAVLGFPNKYSFNFDGSNDYLDISIPQGLVNYDVLEPDGISFSAWVNTSVTSSSTFAIVGQGNSTGNGSFLNGGLYISNNLLQMVLYKNSSYNTLTGSINISADTWHHVCGVYSGENSDDKLRIYVDGVLDNTSSALGGNGLAGTETSAFAFIGRNIKDNNRQYFNGLIDEVAVWDTALSASDVAKIASKPVDFSKASTYATDRTSNLKLWLRAGDKAEPESNTAIARQDFYTDFDGTDDYVDVGSQTPINNLTLSNLSFGCWFKTSDTSKYLFGNQDGNDSGFSMEIKSDGKIRSIVRSATGSYLINDTTSALNDDVWHHIMFTGNLNSGTASGSEGKIYIDGVYEDSASWNEDTTLRAGDSDFTIGTGAGNTSNEFEGQLSSLALYQTALDAQTISQMAKSRFTPMRDNRFSVVDFDGTNDVIAMTTSSAVSPTEAITVSAWVNFTSLENYDLVVGNTDTGTNGWRLAMDNANNIIFAINSWGSNHAETPMSSTGVWHHLVGTYDKSNIKIYLDGELKGTDAYTDSITYSNNVFQIGGATGWSNLTGSISSVSVYNTAKSAEEVYAIYQQGITYDESSLSGLQGYWRMGDDTSKAYPTIADSSSNSNDGTITNGASDDIVQQMVAGYDLGAFESTGQELSGQTMTDTTWTTQGSSQTYTHNGNFNFTVTSDGTGTQSYRPSLNLPVSSGKIYKMTLTPTSKTGTISALLHTGFDSGGGYQSDFAFDGNSTYVYYYESYGGGFISLNGSTGVWSITFDILVQEVLQSADLSDTYPAIIDVNEPVLGAEEVSEPSFASSTGWSLGTGWSISSNTLSSDGSQTAVSNASASITTGAGYYRVVITVDSISSGTIRPNLESWGSYISTTGTSTQFFTLTGNNNLTIQASADFVGSISFASVKEVFGNVGKMTNQDSADLVYSSVLPDQSFLTGLNSAYNFLDFDGTDAYVSVSAINDNYKSISFWFNLGSNATSSTAYTTFGAIGSFQGSGSFITIGGGATSSVTNELITLGASGVITAWESDSDTITGNVWHHLAIVWNGSKYVFYYDGELKDTTSGTASHVSLQSNNSILIGRNAGGSSYYKDNLTSYSVFNKSLSASEVSAIYTAGRHTNLLDSYSDNLLLFLAFGALDSKTGLADTDSTIYDRSGNSNHGTTSGTATGDLKSPPNAEPNGYAKGDTNRSTTTP